MDMTETAQLAAERAYILCVDAGLDPETVASAFIAVATAHLQRRVGGVLPAARFGGCLMLLPSQGGATAGAKFNPRTPR